MAGISSKAVLKTLSNYKYNGGSELEDEGGLDYYNTFYRKYDARIGRFTGVDVMAESNAGMSPFHFGGNNPILYNDPLGDKKRMMREEDEDPGMKDLGNDLTIKTRGMVDLDRWFNRIDEGILEQRMNSGGGKVTSAEGEYNFTGAFAQAVVAALGEAYSSPNEGEFTYTIGTRSNGKFGYWTPFNAGQGAVEFGNTSGEVRVGLQFISINQQNQWSPVGPLLPYSDGDVQNYSSSNGNRYAQFTDRITGQKVNFPGAQISNKMVKKGAAFTNPTGIIRADLSNNLAVLEHEYGHYLQAKYYSTWFFNTIIVPESLKSALLNPRHQNFWTETDASQFAVDFFGPASSIAKDPHFPHHHVWFY